MFLIKVTQTRQADNSCAKHVYVDFIFHESRAKYASGTHLRDHKQWWIFHQSTQIQARTDKKITRK